MKNFILALLLLMPIFCNTALAEQNQAPVTYANFSPEFVSGIKYVTENATAYRYAVAEVAANPDYCLSETSAVQLAALLAEFKPVVFYSGPSGYLKLGGFSVTAVVPWFEFPNGVRIQAGLLAKEFTHGNSPSWVESRVRKDLQDLSDVIAAFPNTWDYVQKK